MRKNKLAIVACLHGNEPYGLEVCKNLQNLCPFFIANEKALKENKRFIDTDLNRCFPGNADGNSEERIAHDLLKKLKEFDYVIDLHSTFQDCPLFGIITNPNSEKIEIVKKMGLKKLVIMNPVYGSGKSLIDFVNCGISLEIGPDARKENVDEATEAIKNIFEEKDLSESELEIFEVFDIVRGDVSNVLIRNFQRIEKGQPVARKRDGSFVFSTFDFIAVLVGKKNYNDVFTLACRKVDKTY